MAEHTYTDLTLANGDLDAEGNESISTFVRCTFSGLFDAVNFSYALFTDCVFTAAQFIRCSFVGAEGNVLPAKGEISFASPPALGARIDVNGRRLGVGDGSTTDYFLALLDVAGALVVVDGVQQQPGADYTPTDSQYESCNFRTGAQAPTTRATKVATYEASHYLGLTSDVSEVPADGTSHATITIQKRDYEGNPATGTETIDLWCAGGRLSVESVDLVDGTAQVLLYASYQTVTGGVGAKDNAGVVKGSGIRIKFIPVV